MERKTKIKPEILMIIATLIAPIIPLIFQNMRQIHINSLKIRESFVSPLIYNKSENLYESNINSSNYLSEGCMLNTYIENVSDKNIAISKYKLVVDSIDSFEMPTADIFSICKDNQLSLYVVNNGNIKLENAKVQLVAYYKENGQINSIPIGHSMLSSIINIRDNNNEIKLPEIKSGQILKFATLDLNVDNFERYDKKSAGIWVDVNTFFDDKYKTEIGCHPLGYLVNHNGNLDIVLGVGGDGEAIKRQVMIKSNKRTPYDIPLHTEFKINANDTEYLQTYIFTEKTCELTFHIEIKKAGKNYLITKPVRQKIFIPLYDPSIYLQKIKFWVEENDIENYHYNDNPSLQKEIEYDTKEDYII